MVADAWNILSLLCYSEYSVVICYSEYSFVIMFYSEYSVDIVYSRIFCCYYVLFRIFFGYYVFCRSAGVYAGVHAGATNRERSCVESGGHVQHLQILRLSNVSLFTVVYCTVP